MRAFKEDVLKVEEISKWLRIPKSTIYKLCLEGQIPGTDRQTLAVCPGRY